MVRMVGRGVVVGRNGRVVRGGMVDDDLVSDRVREGLGSGIGLGLGCLRFRVRVRDGVE